jgi:hypothetical protein
MKFIRHPISNLSFFAFSGINLGFSAGKVVKDLLKDCQDSVKKWIKLNENFLTTKEIESEDD